MESLYIKIPKKAGESIRREFLALGVLDKNLKIKSAGEHLFIPVVRPVQGYGDMGKGDFETVRKEPTTADLLGYAPAYESIGDITIIERHESDALEIAHLLIRKKKARTVLQAKTSISGEYRTRDLQFLAGEKKTETLYRENKCRYLVDVAKVYFTPRLATERMRVAGQVQDGDTVVDMFAGVGPFSILIAKKFPEAHVIAIDKNPVAIHYLRKNVELNKVKNVEIREGDVRDAIQGISEADHIIMNLPHIGLDFLDTAFEIIRKGGIIHFYAITHEDDLFDGTLKRIEEIAHQSNARTLPLTKRVVRPYAPYQYHIGIDLRVLEACLPITGQQLPCIDPGFSSQGI